MGLESLTSESYLSKKGLRGVFRPGEVAHDETVELLEEVGSWMVNMAGRYALEDWQVWSASS